MLTPTNYLKGFLIDDEFMAGVSELKGDASAPVAGYVAYVVNHLSGETVASQKYETLPEALGKLNSIPRSWKYEAAGGCGEGNCAEGGCGTGACGTESCPGVCDHAPSLNEPR